jgi:FkbH-like protein
MRSTVERFNPFNSPRVAQLSQRSNQFNLRTVRYTEADIARMAGEPGLITFSFTLADRFGDNGTIAVVILRMATDGVLFIDTWLMSCRVLKRGMENFVLNVLVDAARAGGFHRLEGEYLPTPKNQLVRDHYRDLGFSDRGDHWVLDLETYQPRKTHIVQL